MINKTAIRFFEKAGQKIGEPGACFTFAGMATLTTNDHEHRTSKMTNCKNCNHQISENFCPNCRHPAQLKRIDKHYISHEVLHLLHFEKGFFYTAKELITRPGASIREFITENRNKHVKPVAFLILTSLLYTVIAHFFHAEDFYNEKEKIIIEKSSVGNIMHWIQTHYGYANIISIFFYAFCVKLFFRKYNFNFFEIMILVCFAMGQAMLLLTVETFFVGLLSKQTYVIIMSFIAFVYPVWVIGQFFDKSKASSYVKAFGAYFLGYLLFYAVIIAVGLTVDLFIKTS